MRSKELHNFQYIYWKKEAKPIYLFIDDFKAKLDYVQKNYSLAKSQTRRSDFRKNGTYYLFTKNNWQNLLLRENNKYVYYKSHKYKDENNEKAMKGIPINSGTKAKQMWNKLFKEQYGITEKTAFGYCDRKLIHRCIPKSVYYINEAFSNTLLHHVSKGDYSSNYPFNIKGDLPDWHNHITLKGTWKPTKDYPFAYYIKSGLIAEYNNFDGHDWLNYSFAVNLLRKPTKHDPLGFDASINENDDITILCKKSNYRFDDVVNKLYEDKCNNVIYDNNLTAKQALNECIGFMHRADLSNGSFRLDHIAAFVLGRADNAMLNNWIKLTYLHIDVLQVIVDGIIYKSDKIIGIPDNEKKVGSLVQEVHDADFIMRGVNAYMFFKDNKCIQERHGAYDKDILTDKPEDIFKWKKEIRNEY